MTCIPYIGVPYESVYGAVTRAAYRFPLNQSTLRTSFQCCPGPHTSFYRADLFQGPRSDELGWQRAITEQTDALGTGDSLADHMFAIRLIFCPICLQYGYHSYLFQLFWLPICPLHRCRLTSQCQACGAPTRLFDFEASLLKRPYMCLQCNCPLAGAPINVADMAFFVDHDNDLRRNMGGLNAWCIQAKRSISVSARSGTRDQRDRVATVASIRWLGQALLRGQVVGFEKLNGSRSLTSASNARCGNSLSTRTRYA
ncbi:hypothetical protein SBC2_71420 (plasmid) [Caballeronia sp. SBC2]|nr:hypothetical protein SBC2_71420 [Caballeronia sp. SBC2]